MPHLGPIELVFLILVVATGLAYVARRVGIAEPILFLLGGIALGFLPDLPAIELSPDVVFLVFLPPILFGAAYFTPIRDFKANVRPILLLAIGLVLFTAIAVAVVTQALVPEMTWPVALTLGAIVAPPDAVAATAVLRRLGVPRRVLTILEGESLINDASSLIIYRTAIDAVLVGSASLLLAGISFFVVGFGGIAVGLVAGWVVTRAMLKTSDPTLEIILSFIAPHRGVPGLGGPRCVGRPGRGRGRPGHGPACGAGPLTGCSPDGRGRLAGGHLGHQRVRLRAHRPAVCPRSSGTSTRTAPASCCSWGWR